MRGVRDADPIMKRLNTETAWATIIFVLLVAWAVVLIMLYV